LRREQPDVKIELPYTVFTNIELREDKVRSVVITGTILVGI
jgi:hypothetical protein